MSAGLLSAILLAQLLFWFVHADNIFKQMYLVLEVAQF